MTGDRPWWRNPAVGPMLSAASLGLLGCLAGNAVIQGRAPLGHWAMWATCVMVIVVLSWLGKRAERRLTVTLAARVPGTPPKAGTVLGPQLFDPARRGPHAVFMRTGTTRIQLRVLPFYRDDGDLWVLYGPPDMVVPEDGEILILSEHRPAALLVQTEEEVRNGKIVSVFSAPPTTDHTPN